MSELKASIRDGRRDSGRDARPRIEAPWAIGWRWPQFRNSASSVAPPPHPASRRAPGARVIARHISSLEIVDTGCRRRWSAAEKLPIVEESFSAIMRAQSNNQLRHSISPKLLTNIRRRLTTKANNRNDSIASQLAVSTSPLVGAAIF